MDPLLEQGLLHGFCTDDEMFIGAVGDSTKVENLQSLVNVNTAWE